MRFSSAALLGLSLASAFVVDAQALTSVAKTTAYLVRPAFAPPDHDAKGVIKLKRTYFVDADTMDIRAMNLDPAGSYSVEIETSYGSASYLFAGYMVFEPSAWRHRCLFREAVEGLPLGASSLDDYLGRRLRIVDISIASTVLTTVIPNVANGSSQWIKPQSTFTHGPSGLDAFAFGRIVTAYRYSDLRQKVTITADNLDPAVIYYAQILTPFFGDIYFNIGQLSPTFAHPSRQVLKIDTATGAPLPNGASSLYDLTGRAIRVVDQYGNVILEGFMP